MFTTLRNQIHRFEGLEGNESVSRDLHAMLPGMLVEQVAAILMENANIFVMGFISTAAIAGVGQINTVNNTLMNLFQAFAIGGTALVAQFAGGAKKKEASQAAFSALLLGGIVSVILTALIFLFHRNIVLAFFGSAEADVIENSMKYFRITALTPPLWFFYFQCCGFMRSAGDTKRPMMISITLNVVGMALNLIFSLGFGLGVTGAALSYLLSVGIAAAISLLVVFHPSFIFRPATDNLQSIHYSLGKIAGISVPSSIENIMFNGSRIILQIFLAGMGKHMISANSVFNSVNSIFNVPVMALYYLTIPVVSRCAGEHNPQKLTSGLRYICRKTFVWSLFVAAAHLLLAHPFSYLFTRDSEVIKIAVGMLMIYAGFALLQQGSFILPNGFKAVGDARLAMVVSSLTAWTIRVLGTWLLGVQLGWGAYAIALTQGLDTLVRALVYFRHFKSGTWLNAMFGPME